jgi:DNA-binding NarL/FixJ family response regulator
MAKERTILIVDDHPFLRHGLRDFIQQKSRFKVIGEGADGEEALRLLSEMRPDILIIDIDMPRLNGLETIRALRQLPFPVKVVILTMYKEEDVYNVAMDLGAKAYLLKENAPNEILEALEKVAGGETFVSPLMQEARQRRGERAQALLSSKPQIEALTPAERRILKLIGEDHTSKEIADQLGLSIRTVDNHRHHICNKLGLHGTHSLLKFAFDNSDFL